MTVANAPSDAPQRASTGGLEIAALVTAIVAAPVGLVLSIIAIFRARSRNLRAAVLALVSLGVSIVFTIGLILAIVIGSLVITGINNAANDREKCARYAQDPTLLNDVDAAHANFEAVTAPYIRGHGPSEDELDAAAETASSLASRIRVVTGSSGLLRQWSDMDDLSVKLDRLSNELKSHDIGIGSNSDVPSESEVQALRDELSAVCR